MFSTPKPDDVSSNTFQNHTVTQSSFAAPCVPINVSTPNMTTPGIKSGFVPVAANATDFMKGIRASFSVMVSCLP